MLDIIRNLVASIFGKILLGIMVLSFALWGVGDLLNSGNSQLAAKVGKQKVTLDDFYYEFQRSIDDFNNSLERRITLTEAYEEKIHTLVINEMVYDQMINVYANNNNIFVNNEILKKNLINLENGKKMKMKKYGEQWFQFKLELPKHIKNNKSKRMKFKY